MWHSFLTYTYCVIKFAINRHWSCFLVKQSPGGVLWKKVFLKISQNSQENSCARVSFLIELQAWGTEALKKETLVQVISCQFCKISENTFFYRTPLVAASGQLSFNWKNRHLLASNKLHDITWTPHKLNFSFYAKLTSHLKSFQRKLIFSLFYTLFTF